MANANIGGLTDLGVANINAAEDLIVVWDASAAGAARTKSLPAVVIFSTAALGADNRLVRSDGTGRNVQSTGITVDDDDNMTGVNGVAAEEVTAESMLFAEGAAADTPPASNVALYGTTDGLLRSKDDAGTERMVSAGHVEHTDVTDTTRTLAIADSGKILRCTNASPVTVTVPDDANVSFLNSTVIGVGRFGAGAVSITNAAGVTISSLNNASTVAGNNAVAVLWKMGTNAWFLGGQIA